MLIPCPNPNPDNWCRAQWITSLPKVGLYRIKSHQGRGKSKASYTSTNTKQTHGPNHGLGEAVKHLIRLRTHALNLQSNPMMATAMKHEYRLDFCKC